VNHLIWPNNQETAERLLCTFSEYCDKNKIFSMLLSMKCGQRLNKFIVYASESLYEGRLKSSWTHLITPSRNFVEVRWRSLFRSTSLRKRCTSYNAPPTSLKRAADRWSLRNFLPRSSRFMVEKAQKSHGARSEFNSVFGLEKVDQWNPIRTSSIHSVSDVLQLWGRIIPK
jgi:hypothetical protein